MYRFIISSLISGSIWFIVFSIPVSSHNNLFTFTQHLLLTAFSDEPTRHTQKNSIDPEKVIDAVTNAFH